MGNLPVFVLSFSAASERSVEKIVLTDSTGNLSIVSREMNERMINGYYGNVSIITVD